MPSRVATVLPRPSPSPISSTPSTPPSDASPSPSNTPISALSQLSRNTSVISSGSSSSSSLSLSSQRAKASRAASPARSARPPGLHLSLASSGLRSRDATPPTTPRQERSAFVGVPRDMIPDEKPSERHMSTASADTTMTLRPGSRMADRSRANSGSGVTPKDFQFGRVLGTGSYSIVSAAYLPQTRQTYAVKVLDKAHILKYQNQGNKVNVTAEKRALATLSKAGHPGVVRLYWALQDVSNLYFVLELCPRGDMTAVLHRLGSISLTCARFYLAQVVDTVFFMHSHGVIHRDLKPDNVLFTDAWRVKIADFGSAKILDGSAEDSRRSSFVGSPQYVSPEILSHLPVTTSTDIWSLGIMLYQFITGRFAFDGPTGGMAHYLMWQKVQALDYTFSEGWDPAAQDLVQALLVLDPERRLGVGAEGQAAMREHAFFEGVDWETLWTCTPPKFESGMVRRDSREVREEEEDVGKAWDALTGGPESEGEMDEEGTEPEAEEGEQPRSGTTSEEGGIKVEVNGRPVVSPDPSDDGALDAGDSRSSGSGSGSVGATWPTSSPNTPRDKWAKLFRPSESALFFSPVLSRAPYSILPAKRRLLVLTDAPRLLCVKEGRSRVIVQVDLPLEGVSVEAKGERGFVVQAASKSWHYATEHDGPPASRWIREIREAQTRSTSRSPPTTPSPTTPSLTRLPQTPSEKPTPSSRDGTDAALVSQLRNWKM